MSPLKAAPLALLALLAPSLAGAAEIPFRAAPDASEAGIVQALYGDFLASNRAVAVESALVDLDGDRVGEVAVRFRHASTCTGERCHTAVLRHDGSGWRVVFEKRTQTLATGAASPGRGGANMAALVADGREVWRWDGRGSYRPLLDSIGTVVVADKPADRTVAAAAAKAMQRDLAGPYAEATAIGGDVRFLATPIDIAASGRSWLVSVDSESLCGGVLGCPQIVLLPEGKGLRSALVTYGIGAVAVLATKSGGLHDLAFADGEGFRTMRWDGSAYRVAATSYPSPTTPAP